MNEDSCRICGAEIVHGFFCRDCLEEGLEKLRDALEEICDEADLENENDRDEYKVELIERI